MNTISVLRESTPLASWLCALGMVTGGLALQAAELDLSKLPPASSRKGLTYAKDIRPLLEASCFRCHGEEKQKGDLRLDSLDSLLKGGEHGKVVTPGQSTKSKLVIAVSHLDEEFAMPPKFKGPPGGGPGGRGGPGGGPPGPRPGAGGLRPGGPGGPGGFGPPPKPFTPEEVGLTRAWVDQGAK